MPYGDDVSKYLTRARCCVEIANTMTDVKQKLILLDMAQVWARLANQTANDTSADLSHDAPPPAER